MEYIVVIVIHNIQNLKVAKVIHNILKIIIYRNHVNKNYTDTDEEVNTLVC